MTQLASVADGRGIVVAVIDSGVAAGHPQLAGAVLAGRDFLDGDDARIDCHGHGTAVASLIAARPADQVAFRGLAPEAVILPVRISEQEIVQGHETGRTVNREQFAEAIRWAVENGAQVLNLSVVLYEDDPVVAQAIADTVADDVVVVAAAGNLHDAGDPTPYPAAYPGVLGVGAIGADGTRTAQSQSGSYVDLTAPGSEILAAAPGHGHTFVHGTSFATPFVAATAALVRQYHPQLSAAEVAARVLATTDPAPGGRHSPGYGAGVLNPYRAVVDVLPGEAARAVPPRSVVPPHPAAADAARRISRARTRAVWLAGSGTAIAVLVLIAAVVLPRGMRRRWWPA